MMTASGDVGTGTCTDGSICGTSLETKPRGKRFTLVQRMCS